MTEFIRITLQTPWILAIALFTHTSAGESPGDKNLPRLSRSGGKPARFFFFFWSNKQVQVSTDKLKSFFLFYIVRVFTSASCQQVPLWIVAYPITELEVCRERCRGLCAGRQQKLFMKPFSEALHERLQRRVAVLVTQDTGAQICPRMNQPTRPCRAACALPLTECLPLSTCPAYK